MGKRQLTWKYRHSPAENTLWSFKKQFLVANTHLIISDLANADRNRLMFLPAVHIFEWVGLDSKNPDSRNLDSQKVLGKDLLVTGLRTWPFGPLASAISGTREMPLAFWGPKFTDPKGLRLTLTLNLTLSALGLYSLNWSWADLKAGLKL